MIARALRFSNWRYIAVRIRESVGTLQLGEPLRCWTGKIPSSRTIERLRRIICAPGKGRKRMSTFDALRMLNMDDWEELEQLLIIVNGTKDPIRRRGTSWNTFSGRPELAASRA